MGVRRWALLALALVSACTVVRAPAPPVIALLAPFEGEWREVGYNALYSARMALSDAGEASQLLAVDDGGTYEAAASHARALAGNSSVRVVILLGPFATHAHTQSALNDLPAIIVGGWGARPTRPNVVQLASPDLPDAVAAADAELHGDERLMLAYSLRMLPHSADVVVYTSGSPASEAFAARYARQGAFVPQPNPLAMLVYDAALIASQWSAGAPDFSSASAGARTYRFSSGYWLDAPVNRLTLNAAGYWEMMP
jgi:hypothetical protein